MSTIEMEELRACADKVREERNELQAENERLKAALKIYDDELSGAASGATSAFIQRLRRERDELKENLNRKWIENYTCNPNDGQCGGCLECVMQQVEHNMNMMEDEMKSVKADRDKAMKAAAEMREAMLSVLCDPEGNPCFSGAPGDRDVIAHALSTDCGKDFVPRSELEKAQAAAAEMRSCLEITKLCVKNEIISRELQNKTPSVWPDVLTGCVSGGGIEHALSTDCGKDFVQRAELDKIKELNTKHATAFLETAFVLKQTITACEEAVKYLPACGVGGYYHQGRLVLENAIACSKEVLSNNEDCGKGWVSPEAYANVNNSLKAMLALANEHERKLTLAVEGLKKVKATKDSISDPNWSYVASIEYTCNKTIAAIEKGNP